MIYVLGGRFCHDLMIIDCVNSTKNMAVKCIWYDNNQIKIEERTFVLQHR